MPAPQVLALADDYWAYVRETAQLWNIDRGDVDQVEHWDDLRPVAVAERRVRLRAFADDAEARAGTGGDGAGADDDALLSVIAADARATAASLPWVRDRSLVSTPMGFAAVLSVLVPRYPLATAEHGAGYLAKLTGLPDFVEGWAEGLREGLTAGRVATAQGVTGTMAALEAQLALDPADDPLAGQAPPVDLPPAAATAWRDDVEAAIAEHVRPALNRLHHVLRDEVLPVARPDDAPGLCHLPGGDEAYAALLDAATSIETTPQAVHEIGLRELARLDEEYREVAGPVLGEDDPEAIRARLLEDPALRYADAGELVADAEAVLDRALAEAPGWFRRLPLASCRAVAVEQGAMAYYTAPSPDGRRGGTFFFDTSDPTAWGRHVLEATTFHESVPGHHLQLALAQELDLHPVVAELEVTSYVEGWGLYAERLADEMGLYSSELQRVGMLALDSLRAARLVVDTGLHAMGWTRGHAVDVLQSYTAESRRVTEREVDRYIADPGQACSYMIGRLELDRLRADARSRLGAAFDVRDFHDAVLGGGMLPLGALARRVERWVTAGGAAPPRGDG